MSPVNMWTTSICDELRLATNFQAKVIGVAIKDRGSILPAGHSANAAYWYRRAGQPVCRESLDQEWESIVSAFLKRAAAP